MKILKPLFAVGVALSLVACSATPVRRSFKESVRDSKIKVAIKVKLMKDNLVKARHMEVDVWRGVVTLHGRALSAEERSRAEELSHSVKHVVAVENELHVVNDAVALRTVAPQSQVPLTSVVSPTSPPAALPAPAAPATPAAAAGTVVATRGAAVATKPAASKPAASKTPAPKTAETKTVAAKKDAKTPVTTGVTAKKENPVSVNDIRPSSAVAMPLVAPAQTGANKPPKVPAGAPAPMARKANGGKTLPWYGEVPDDEAPAIRPSKEISSARTASATKAPVSADEDLAREAAEELKRLKGTTTR